MLTAFQSEQLRGTLTSLGSTIISDEETQAAVEADRLLFILPHDVAKTNPLPDDVIPDDFQVVSELWLEKCMIAKSFIAPRSYPLGQVIRQPRTSLKGFTVNVSGFDGLENVHIIKIVKLLGGTYSKAFTSAVSVLVCRATFANKDKLNLAHHFRIPVVSEEWLLSTMKGQSRADIKDYLLQAWQDPLSRDQMVAGKEAPMKNLVQPGNIALQAKPGNQPARRQAATVETLNNKEMAGERPKKTSTTVLVHQEVANGDAEPEIQESSGRSNASGRGGTLEESVIPGERPLRELSPTSARRNGRAAEGIQVPIHSLDGASSMEQQSKENAADIRTKPTDIEAINGALRDILNERTKKKTAGSKGTGEPRKKNTLIGRALSNLSNASSTSNVRHSRASSIDSINTDGRGSELPAILSGEFQSGEPTSAPEKASFSFTGRAKTALAGFASAAFGMDDLDSARSGGYQAEQEAAPRMTQLGYEDPEEAVLLREKLAASRKNRSKRTGSENDEDQTEKSKHAAKQKPVVRKLRDDDILAGADVGWGAGRRTRHKQRSPQGLKEF